MHERLSQTVDAYTAIRRDLHTHPELAFQENRTSELVSRELASYGYAVTRKVGRTGVVATLSRGTGRKCIGLRADMDALPILENTGLSYASRNAGKMHACGHDGHVAMLLCAARQLADYNGLDGTLHLIFQPAEEDCGGAREMIADGLFERFRCDAVYALHNFPGIAENKIAYRFGPIMAAVDTCYVRIKGTGGHGALPHLAIDPVVIASSIVMALQTVVSRNMDPVGNGAVITVGRFHAGACSNVIPEYTDMDISIRTFNPETRENVRDRVCRLIENHAAGYGAKAELHYETGYAATVNSPAQTKFVRDVASATFGAANVCELEQPYAASEDFSAMLEHKPGCFFGLGIGNEAGRPFLHDPRYDFNDDCLLTGAAMWVNLASSYLKQ